MLPNCFRSAVVLLLELSWMPLEPNLEPLGRLLERLGRLLERLGRLLEPTWSLLGGSWRLLGASWRQLGGFWAPLGANLDALGHPLRPIWSLLGALGRLLDSTWSLLGAFGTPFGPSNWPLSATWIPLGLQAPRSATALPQQLPLPTDLFQDFICNARRSAKCNNTSVVLPKGCQVQQQSIINETSRRRMATYATLVVICSNI